MAPQTSIPSVAKVLKSRRGLWREIDIGSRRDLGGGVFPLRSKECSNLRIV